MNRTILLALQHVVAIIVGCVTPTIIISGAVGINTTDRVLLIQASLVVSALATLLQFFPSDNRNGFHLDSDLLVIPGVSFAYVPSMQVIAKQSGIPAILGAQIIDNVYATLVGLTIKEVRKFFSPLIAGMVVFTTGLSFYHTAIDYITGGVGQPIYNAWQNWAVAIFTLAIVTMLDHFTKGFLKLASILIGMIVGCVSSVLSGMVSSGNAAEFDAFQPPQVIHFGISFEASVCMALRLLFVINPVQAVGDFSITTAGGPDRELTTNELHGVILGYSFLNIIDAPLGYLPTVTYSRDVDIVATIKVVDRVTLELSALTMLAAGLFPKFSTLLTAIPYTVLGDATVSVFTPIAMTGIKLAMVEDMNYRGTSIVGLAAALGMGASQASAPLSAFPTWVTIVLGKPPVVIATLVAIPLNITLPKDIGKAEKN